MPLSRATPRKLLHSRDIQLRGYEREDGLVDIEARMTDTKSYSWRNHDRGGIHAGEPLHDMWMRVTVGPDMVIRAVEAEMDATPYQVCPGAAPNFERLVGLNIGKGFLKAAMALVGGVEGCTHLRELLQPIATVAFQTMFSLQHGRRKQSGEGEKAVPDALVNTCYAYDAQGPVVARGKAEAASS
ncbi:MAG: hypothetical protein B7Z81_00570 [Acidocella sp. 20-61-6]|nr:MAG: hypothetical protein B7Z81_00570 [Acidocella sp. 20-61-6]